MMQATLERRQRMVWVTVSNGSRWRVYRVGQCIYIGGSPIEQYPQDVQERARDELAAQERGAK